MSFRSEKDEVVENFDLGGDVHKVLRWIAIVVVGLIVLFVIWKVIQMRSSEGGDSDEASMSFHGSPKRQNFGFRFY